MMEIKVDITKAYKKLKCDIDRWFSLYCTDDICTCKTEDIIECIYCIGKASMLAIILEKNFGEDTKEERKNMAKIKGYLEKLLTVTE